MSSAAAGLRCTANAAPAGAIIGAVGAWVGLVVGKIMVSDWDSLARTSRGSHTVKVSIGVGSAVGLLSGASVRVSRCLAANRAAARRLLRPEIDRAGIRGSALDAIVALRPEWLGTAARPTNPTVVLNNSRLRSIDQLRVIPLGSVQSMAATPANEADARWGVSGGGIVIQVYTGAARTP